MKKITTDGALLLCALVASGMVLVTTGTMAYSQQPLPPHAKFRGTSFEEWNVLQSEWAMATELGDATDLSDTVKGV